MELERALDELGNALTDANIPLWKAPESTTALEELEATIAPMRLPDEVRRFWTQVDPYTLRVHPYPEPAGPDAALTFWRMSRNEFRSLQPLTLVGVGFTSHKVMSAELEVGDLPGGALFEWEVSDPSGFTRRFDGLAGWIAHIAELVRRGNHRRVQASHGFDWLLEDDQPRTGAHIGGDILDWPEHWQRANGVTDEDLRLRGATHTIAEVLASPPDTPLQATIVGKVTDLAGSADWARARVHDGTGALDVFCPPGTTLLGPRISGWYELDIEVDSGERHTPADPETAADGIEDPVEHVAAVLMARYGGPAGATVRALRRAPPG